MLILVTTLIFAVLLTGFSLFMGIRNNYGKKDALFSVILVVISVLVYYNVFCWSAYKFQKPYVITEDYAVKRIMPISDSKYLSVETDFGDTYKTNKPLNKNIKVGTPYRLVIRHTAWTPKQILFFGSSHLDNHKLHKDVNVLVQ